MGLFSFTQEIAMDLGTANTIIITNGKIVVDEPSVVALDRRTEKMIAVGEKAKLMHEKTHENIRTIRPLRDGVIADFYACEQMMRGLIKQVNTRNHLFCTAIQSYNRRLIHHDFPVRDDNGIGCTQVHCYFLCKRE